MNLGNAALKTVSSNRPQLAHSRSQRSASASEEYFSDYASDASSATDTAAQYDTPPSKTTTPTPPKTCGTIESEMTLPQRPLAAHRPSMNARLAQAAAARPSPTLLRGSLGGDISPDIDDTPYIRFAIDQLTRDEELLGRGRQGSVVSDDYPINRIVGDEGLGYYGDPAPVAQLPRPPSKSLSQLTDHVNLAGPQVLLPVNPPDGTQWGDLRYVPVILRPFSLILLIFASIFMIVGLIFSNVHALKSYGLYDYDGTGTSRYFVFQFLPQLLGIVIILFLFVIQAAIYRIMPFFMMASRNPMIRVLQDVPILPANFLFPHLVYFKVGEPMVGCVMVMFWLSYFTVPLLSCTYQTAYLDNLWRWTSVQDVAWILVALYIGLIVALILCIVRFRPTRSALRWDPVSLADLIPLFQRSNILHYFERAEISASMRTHIPSRRLRLGYWTTSRGPHIFHSVGECNEPIRPSAEEILRTEKPEQLYSDSLDGEHYRHSNTESFTRNIHSPFIRYRWVPWFLRDSAVLVWAVTALALLTAFIVVSFTKQAVELGFMPRLPTKANSRGFSASNFLYSFLPCLLGMFLFLAWQPIDVFFRAVQPFTNLSNPKGAIAGRSILLAYPSCYPIEATVLALLNRDLKVAWISFISLASISIPVLAGGVFTSQLFESQNEIRVAAAMSAYDALVVFVTIYAISFFLVWPKRKRYLPHKIHTLADLLSFLYQSPLLVDPVFREPDSKADLVARLVNAPSGNEGEKGGWGRGMEAQYAYGIYVGRDGREHLGVDRLQRPGSGEMLITTGMTR